ncbi:MAG: preprotein translocase subunit SecG [Verrucomicrobiota bacterium]
MAIVSILLTVVLLATSVLMVLIVLLQRPKQEGLGAAFGGGTLDAALGAHTTDILQKITTWLGIIFFVSAISLMMVQARAMKQSAAKGVFDEVEAREPTLPGLPPEMLSDLPGTQTIDPLTETLPGETDPLAPIESPAESDAPDAAEGAVATPESSDAPAPAESDSPAAPTEAAPEATPPAEEDAPAPSTETAPDASPEASTEDGDSGAGEASEPETAE